ncbi:hypothetical protein C8J56DRAFT_7599 [Mycena floridula]|nr:hypothetical protein C8J56DRAFT_7599 [Mycena floridula]
MLASSSIIVLVAASAVMASPYPNAPVKRVKGSENSTVSFGKRDTFENKEMTWYPTDTGADACTGKNHQDSDWYVAMGSAQFGDGSACCGKQLQITYNGKSTVATCVDECMSCPQWGQIDLTKGLFEFFTNGDLDIGVIYGSWSYVGSGDDDEPAPTTTKKPATTHKTTPTTTPRADPTTVKAKPTTVKAKPTTVKAKPTTVKAKTTHKTTPTTTPKADPNTVKADAITVQADPTTPKADPTTTIKTTITVKHTTSVAASFTAKLTSSAEPLQSSSFTSSETILQTSLSTSVAVSSQAAVNPGSGSNGTDQISGGIATGDSNGAVSASLSRLVASLATVLLVVHAL